MKRLFYIRHAETEMNVAGLFAGQIETPLTNNGKHQAKEAAKKLKTDMPDIDLIVCSPLSRTYETAKIIALEIGYPVEKIRKNDLFLERSFGVLEGTPAHAYLGSPRYKEIDNVEKAESIEQLQVRAMKALDYVKTLKEENVLVVSHGGFGRAFRRAVNNWPHTHEYVDGHIEKFKIGNAEILELL